MLTALAAMAAPAAAADGPRLSLGYAYVHYLEEGGGSAPVGAYLSFWSANATGLELDLGYQRDSEQGDALNTFTATAGLRFTGQRQARPYLHLLGGIRHDWVEGASNNSFGGMAGLGVDVPAGGLYLRLGVDFQIFFDEGENLKTLRLSVGLSF